MTKFVTLIEKPHAQSEHQEITRLGNFAENWDLTREQMVSVILSGAMRFLVINPQTGRWSELRWTCPARGVPYVVACAEGATNCDLLSIPWQTKIVRRFEPQESWLAPAGWAILGGIGLAFVGALVTGSNRPRRSRRN